MGERAFRAQQIFPWLHQRGVTDFAAMTNIGKALAARLAGEAVVTIPEMASEHLSEDGTRKWVLRLADGNAIETVFIPEALRNTLCISSQVGCALDCAFCATAQQGFNRNLTAAEIVGQVWFAEHRLRARLRVLRDRPAGIQPQSHRRRDRGPGMVCRAPAAG